jgi:hypothetical protein
LKLLLVLATQSVEIRKSANGMISTLLMITFKQFSVSWLSSPSYRRMIFTFLANHMLEFTFLASLKDLTGILEIALRVDSATTFPT